MAEALREEWLWIVPSASLIHASVVVGDVLAFINHCSILRLIILMSACVIGGVIWVDWARPVAGLGIPEWILVVTGAIIIRWAWSIRIWAINLISVPLAEEDVGASSIGGLVSTILDCFSILASSIGNCASI
jgi:hypothetical protein